MASVSVSIGVAVLTFGVGLLGLYLKRLVPERHMSAGSRDMIGAMIGLLSDVARNLDELNEVKTLFNGGAPQQFVNQDQNDGGYVTG